MNNLVRIIVFGCLAFIIVFTACTSDDPEGSIIVEPPELEYPKTINTSIKSSYAFDSYNYPITISYPEAMNTNKNLPVIYVLDGYLNLQNAQRTIGSNNSAIIVGIGDMASKQMWQRRWVDLHPTGSKCSGGKGKHLDFYNFITKQIFPLVEVSKGVNPTSRTLIGHSSAAVFTLASMFMQDAENVMFNNFISSDPELGCDAEYFMNLLDNHNFSNANVKFNFYLALSMENGNLEAVRQFSEHLREKELSWLTYKYEEFLDQDHMGVVEPSFRSGFNFVFE